MLLYGSHFLGETRRSFRFTRGDGVVALHGCMGAGKSTICNWLRLDREIEVRKEPLKNFETALSAWSSNPGDEELLFHAQMRIALEAGFNIILITLVHK